MTITLGWWLLPLAITVAVWAWAFRPQEPHYGMDISGLFEWAGAIIVTLLAWVTYLGLTLLAVQS